MKPYSLFRINAVLLCIFASAAFCQEAVINATRVVENLHHLSIHNDLTPPAVQRILYTTSDISARKYIQSLMESIGLDVTHDAVGNLFGTWHGTSAEPAVLTGSHIDAIPHSGMYDGTLGVIGAIEAIKALQESGFSPRRSISVVMFTSEEPTRFGLSCIGSRLLVGALETEALDELKDSSEVSFHEARKKAGYEGDVRTVRLNAQSFSAFVELHIEQADVLETAAVDIGAVTHIAAPAAAEVTFEGSGGHAGSWLMKYRNDAGLAGAQLALAVERIALDRGDDCVATTGKFEVFPGAINSVPKIARLGIDVRDVNLERRDSALHDMEKEMMQIATLRNVTANFMVKNKDDPAACDGRVVNAVIEAAAELNLTFRHMVSRAYHDALFMAKLFPTGMIFVPCQKGVSHRPDEFVYEHDIHNGVAVLAAVLGRLAGEEKTEL